MMGRYYAWENARQDSNSEATYVKAGAGGMNGSREGIRVRPRKNETRGWLVNSGPFVC
jgi:hypothetical protein